MRIKGENTQIENAEQVILQHINLTKLPKPIDAFWLAFALTHGALIAVASAIMLGDAFKFIRSFVAGL